MLFFFFFQASCEPDDYSCPTSNGQVCLDGDAECDGIELCPGLEDERDCGEFFLFFKRCDNFPLPKGATLRSRLVFLFIRLQCSFNMENPTYNVI